MPTFKNDLVIELTHLIPVGQEVRIKKGLFIIESKNNDIHHEEIEDLTKELENNIGGSYDIKEANGPRAVILYQNN